MRTSKALFQSSPAFKGYQDIVANPAFESSCHAAIMGLIESLPTTAADPSKSWDCYLQIVGARNVLDHLSRLHEPDTTPTPQKWPSLKYDEAKPTRP